MLFYFYMYFKSVFCGHFPFDTRGDAGNIQSVQGQLFIIIYCLPALEGREKRRLPAQLNTVNVASRRRRRRGGKGETVPISGAGEKSRAFAHSGFLRVGRPRLSGEKAARNGFLPFIRPSMTLARDCFHSPATVTRHFEVTSK